jgi:hypothetical protein
MSKFYHGSKLNYSAHIINYKFQVIWYVTSKSSCLNSFPLSQVCTSWILDLVPYTDISSRSIDLKKEDIYKEFWVQMLNFLPVLENKCKIIEQEVKVFTKNKARGLVNWLEIFENLCYERG